MPRKPRSKAPAPTCAVCYRPRAFDVRLAVYVCRHCQPHKAQDGDTPETGMTFFEGVEVDST